MAVSAETRAAVRAAFDGRCGYCDVSETSVGGALEIDHFHPVAVGGSDATENLVYACTACNRFKGDHAPLSMHQMPCGFFTPNVTTWARTSPRRPMDGSSG